MDKEVLRKVQLTELEILKEMKRICERHGLHYYLACGTLLGAVRHEGFIPWDDDVDVVMPYRDYVRFIRIAKKELPEDYFIQNSFTDINYPRPFTKIRKNNTTFQEHALLGADVHQGIWIDIFPLIETSAGIDYKLKQFLIKTSNYCQAKKIFERNREEFKRNIGVVFFYLITLFYYVPESIRIYLHKIMLAYAFNGHGSHFAFVWIELSKIIDKNIFTDGCVYLTFENEKFPVPYGWDKWLSLMYGDYMTLPPENERGSHNPTTIDFEKGDYKTNR